MYHQFSSELRPLATASRAGSMRLLQDDMAFRKIVTTHSNSCLLREQGCFPFLIRGDTMFSVDLSVRKRHYFLYGAAFGGKSFAAQRLCLANDLSYRFLSFHDESTYDGYCLEQFLIFDDFVDMCSDPMYRLHVIADMERISSDLWRDQLRYGRTRFGESNQTRQTRRTRYTTNHFPSADLVMLITSNMPPPRWLLDWDGFASRFNVIRVDDGVSFVN